MPGLSPGWAQEASNSVARSESLMVVVFVMDAPLPFGMPLVHCGVAAARRGGAWFSRS